MSRDVSSHEFSKSSCVSELKFSVFTPSAVACSSVTAAVVRLNVLKDAVSADGLLQLLRSVLDLDMVRTDAVK